MSQPSSYSHRTGSSAILLPLHPQVDEPEALRKMREEREAREARERAEKEAKQQETNDAAAAADAKLRAETGNFISGQDLREARMVDEYERQKVDLCS